MDEAFADINNHLEDLINKNQVSDIYQITEEFDDLINKEAEDSASETSYFLYKKGYESLKANVLTYFGSILQSKNF